MPNKAIDDGTKIQALTLVANGGTATAIGAMLGISQPQLGRLRKKAIERGWRGTIESPLRLCHVADDLRSGRPRNDVPEVQAELEAIVQRDGKGRHAMTEELACKLGVSTSSIDHYLQQLGYNKLKMTTKPGLTEQMRKQHLQ